MALEKAQAVIIRLSDYSETSQIVTFLTDTHGKVRAIAKGSKRAASSTGGSLDMLTLNDIVFSPSRSEGLATLREAKTLEQFNAAGQSAAHYYAALYFAELSEIFGEGAEGSTSYFDLLCEGLRALSGAAAPSIRSIVMYFESHLLAVSGLALNLDDCAACGGPAQTGANARLSLAHGGLLCSRCAGGVRIAPATLAALKRVFASTTASVQRLRLSPRTGREVEGVLQAAVVAGGHREPRLAKYVRPGAQRSWRRWMPSGVEFEAT